MSRRDEVRERHEKATNSTVFLSSRWFGRISARWGPIEVTIADVAYPVYHEDRGKGLEEQGATASFLMHAFTDIPYLLSLIDTCEEALSRIADFHQDYSGDEGAGLSLVDRDDVIALEDALAAIRGEGS